MFRNIWFQLHWFFGITAGVILIIVGVTGGMLSFQSEILRLMNPGVLTVTVPAGAEKLDPTELLRKLQREFPDRTVNSLTLHTGANRSASVNLASADPRMRRGETRYVNPYTGELLGEVKGQSFFSATMRLHRWLLTDEFFHNRTLGKQIVGASTVLCILLSITGIYLRWPRQVRSLKVWLTFDLKRRGRGFVWDMHAVLGTWVLIPFLIMSLTGLYWSYGWYRNMLFDISGVPRPAARVMPPPAAPEATPEGVAPAQRGGEGSERTRPEGRSGERGSGAGRESAAPSSAAIARELGVVWTSFQEASQGNFSQVQLRIPQGNGQEVSVTYQDARPQHERANNRMTIHPVSGEVTLHDRYADRPLNVRLMGSMLPLHAGSYWGLPGKIIFMVASILMPLFTITGFMLYFERRRHKKAALAIASEARQADADENAEPLLIAYASQTGYSESLAWQSAAALQKHGYNISVKELGSLSASDLGSYSRALFLVSTFGDGEPPVSARPFVRLMAEGDLALNGFEYALLAVGDRQYELYCKFGHELDAWLRDHGAVSLYPMVEVDNGDPEAIARWQQQLASFPVAGSALV